VAKILLGLGVIGEGMRRLRGKSRDVPGAGAPLRHHVLALIAVDLPARRGDCHNHLMTMKRKTVTYGLAASAIAIAAAWAALAAALIPPWAALRSSWSRSVLVLFLGLWWRAPGGERIYRS